MPAKPEQLRWLISKARRECRESFDLGPAVLYRLCRRYPDHQNSRKVSAKIWLIGRSMAAPLERSLGIRGTIVDKYHRVARAMRRSGIDSLLRRMRGREPRQIDDLSAPLRAHERVLKALRPLSHRDARSFVAKYLHFHAPAWFFIYDSVAREALRALQPRPRMPNGLASIGDSRYRDFVVRAWRQRATLAELSPPLLSPRGLDVWIMLRGA